MFSETVTNITVNVTLLDDNALEGDEDFKAQLSSGSNVRLPDEPEAIITIVDDDSKTFLAFIRDSCQPCDLFCGLLPCLTIKGNLNLVVNGISEIF